MHPYSHVFLHRGPSRILWFLLGAGTATWWHYSDRMRDHRAQYFPCVMQRRRLQDDASDTQPAPGPIAPAWQQQRDWEQDRERLRNIQKRAADTAVDLSESTLDSILAGAEALKAKLAELRTERERLEAEKKGAQQAA